MDSHFMALQNIRENRQKFPLYGFPLYGLLLYIKFHNIRKTLRTRQEKKIIFFRKIELLCIKQV